MSKISPNKFYRKSRGSKNRGSRKKYKNNFEINLGKTVIESPKIKDSIALNNFNVKNANLPTNNNQNNIKISKNSDKKTKFRQQRIDKYVISKTKNSKIDKYYKSPVNKNRNNNIHINMINNVPNKNNEEKDKKFNKVRVRVNRSYYQNIDKKLFNPNTIKSTKEQFDNMNSEDIYICNLISQNVIFNQ